jgi:glycosyltransferase involved in cell wall biosynthesis
VTTVFVLPFGADTGGVNHQIVDAFKRERGWLVRGMISASNYIGYPADLPWDIRLLQDWWVHSDVIHLSHEFYRLRKIERLRLPTRPKVIHYHGTGYRERADDLIRHQRAHRAIGLVATIDLWLLNPDETEWLPCPYDLESLQNMACTASGSPRRPDKVKVAHAPTARKIKSTEPFLHAVKRLQSEGYDLELDLIEGVSWAECLARKASADLYFDQTILGYGNNAIEAWGMGIPVIAGASEKTLAEMRRRFSNDLPFYQTSEAGIYDALKAMLESRDLRAEYGEKGLSHVRRFHDQRVVVEQLKDVYQRAVDGKH